MNESTSEGNELLKEITTELVQITDTESSLFPKELNTSIELLDITVMYVSCITLCTHKHPLPHDSYPLHLNDIIIIIPLCSHIIRYVIITVKIH